MASKNRSWVKYKRGKTLTKWGKTLALSGFMKIQRPISSIDSSIPILFECQQSIFICGSSQEFAPKAFQTEFAVCHAFDRKAAFSLKSNLRSSKIWHLENRMKKKIWHNSFKNLLQKLFKLILQCFMLSREEPLFDWNQTRIERRRKFDTMHSKFVPRSVQTEFAVLHTSEKEVTFWLKRNRQSSKLAFQESYALYAEENLTQFIQEIRSKTFQIEFAERHAFDREVIFWVKSNLQSWKSGISRVAWRTDFTLFCSSVFGGGITGVSKIKK